MNPLKTKIFIDFLKNNNCYEQYVKNKRKNTQISDIINCVNIGFIWKETLEGIDYWRNIHNEWNNYLKNKVKIVCQLKLLA